MPFVDTVIGRHIAELAVHRGQGALAVTGGSAGDVGGGVILERDPDWDVTPESAIVQVVEHVLRRINPDTEHPGAVQCCRWHLALSDVSRGLTIMKSRRCDPVFSVFGGKQCLKCKLLSRDSDARCSVCGGTLREHEASPEERMFASVAGSSLARTYPEHCTYFAKL